MSENTVTQCGPLPSMSVVSKPGFHYLVTEGTVVFQYEYLKLSSLCIYFFKICLETHALFWSHHLHN